MFESKLKFKQQNRKLVLSSLRQIEVTMFLYKGCNTTKFNISSKQNKYHISLLFMFYYINTVNNIVFSPRF